MCPDISPYIHRLGLQHATFSRIEHEDAIVAEVYKVTLMNGETYVLKICKKLRHYEHERFFLSHFATRIPVPQIIQLVPPEEHLPGAILMEYLPGELLSTQVITENIAHELGAVLAKIHAERTTRYGDMGQQLGNRLHLSGASSYALRASADKTASARGVPRNTIYAGQAGAQDYIAKKFEEAFAECVRDLPQELLKNCRRYYEAHTALLNTVDGPCFTHRDFRPANIMVESNKLQGIIDWSSSRAGFAEEDFIPLESGPYCAFSAPADREWNISSQAKEAFLAGYAIVRPVPDYKAIMPLLQMIRAIFTIGYTIKSGTWNSNGARAYQSSLQILEKLTMVA